MPDYTKLPERPCPIAGMQQVHASHNWNLQGEDLWCIGFPVSVEVRLCPNHDRHLAHDWSHDDVTYHCPGLIYDDLAIPALNLESELRDWWLTTARDEVERVVPKAVEYGATDLREIGRIMRESMSYRGVHTDASDAELGVYFYVVGKVARWTDAIIAGRKVSDDTLHDIGVYIRMAQRIRFSGGWPK